MESVESDSGATPTRLAEKSERRRGLGDLPTDPLWCPEDEPGFTAGQRLMRRREDGIELRDGFVVSEALRSEWIEKEKALHREILLQGKYDLLLVPFQIRGSGLDGTARSLMTRYLDARLREGTKLRIPSPSLVARALGGYRRAFDQAEVYALANDLGAVAEDDEDNNCTAAAATVEVRR